MASAAAEHGPHHQCRESSPAHEVGQNAKVRQNIDNRKACHEKDIAPLFHIGIPPDKNESNNKNKDIDNKHSRKINQKRHHLQDKAPCQHEQHDVNPGHGNHNSLLTWSPSSFGIHMVWSGKSQRNS